MGADQSDSSSDWGSFFYAVGALIFLFFDFIALLLLSDTAYGVQICSLIGYTCLVGMHVFLRNKLGKGYSFPDRDEQPLFLKIVSIHGVFCIAIFSAQTFLMRRWKTFPASWTVESGPKHDSGLATSMIGLLVVVMMLEIWLLRSTLARAHRLSDN